MTRARSTEIRRAQLLAVGKRVFAERAYDDVSTEAIAEAGGISVGLLYHYFRDKRGFYVETIRDTAAELLDAVRFRPGLGLAEAAPRALLGFFEFVEAKPALFRGLMRGGVGADAEVHEVVDGVRREVMERLLVAAGRPAGLADASPRERLALYGWVGLVEATTLAWLDSPDVDRGVLLEVIVAALPAFLLAPEAP